MIEYYAPAVGLKSGQKEVSIRWKADGVALRTSWEFKVVEKTKVSIERKTHGIWLRTNWEFNEGRMKSV